MAPGFHRGLSFLEQACATIEAELRDRLIMKASLSKLLKRLTPAEQAEVETFAAFLLARRNLKNVEVLTDDASTEELLQLVADSGSFEWLDAPEEDVYSAANGAAVQWPR